MAADLAGIEIAAISRYHSEKVDNTTSLALKFVEATQQLQTANERVTQLGQGEATSKAKVSQELQMKDNKITRLTMGCNELRRRMEDAQMNLKKEQKITSSQKMVIAHHRAQRTNFLKRENESEETPQCLRQELDSAVRRIRRVQDESDDENDALLTRLFVSSTTLQVHVFPCRTCGQYSPHRTTLWNSGCDSFYSSFSARCNFKMTDSAFRVTVTVRVQDTRVLFMTLPR